MAAEIDVVKKPHIQDEYDFERIEELRKCAEDPLYFITKYVQIQHPKKGAVPFEPFEYQKKIIEGYNTYRYVILMTGRQMGKALALDTPILTTKGWSTMGDLKVGDRIYGSDGLPTTVTFATEVMHKHRCFKIDFDNGEQITADAEHLWTILNDSKEAVTSQEIYNRHNAGENIKIKVAKPLYFSAKNAHIDLYEAGRRFPYVNTLPDNSAFLSIDQKIAFLSGVVDSDGYYDGCFYNQTYDIILALRDILSTMQIWSKWSLDGSVYSLEFSFPSINSAGNIVSEYTIVKIKPTKSVPVRCIQVDSDDHLFLCGKTLIPTHNTTCSASFLLWRAMFTPDFCILVAANKLSAAVEVLDRIRYSYEQIPNWLRAGVTEYNKRSIAFDNGSRIVARATTPDSGRGLSISLLYVDEFAFVKPSIAPEFWKAILPTLSTGGNCIVTSTPGTDEDQFAQIWHAANNIYDENGNENPGGVGKNDFKAFMFKWYEHPERDADYERSFRASLGDMGFERECNCAFVGEDSGLVDGLALKNITPADPITVRKNVYWYSEIEPNQHYFVTLDPALGAGGGDYAAIQVFKMPECVQVAEWRSQTKSPKDQVIQLMEILRQLYHTLDNHPDQEYDPEISWTIENNSVGQAHLQVIRDTGEDMFPGMFISEPRKKGHTRRIKGMNTNKASKLQACLKLKYLIESRRMTIKSKALLKELKSYVRNDGSYAAKTGETDDLIAAVLLAVRMAEVVGRDDEDIYEVVDSRISFDDDDDDYSFEPLPILI